MKIILDLYRFCWFMSIINSCSLIYINKTSKKRLWFIISSCCIGNHIGFSKRLPYDISPNLFIIYFTPSPLRKTWCLCRIYFNYSMRSQLLTFIGSFSLWCFFLCYKFLQFCIAKKMCAISHWKLAVSYVSYPILCSHAWPFKLLCYTMCISC